MTQRLSKPLFGFKSFRWENRNSEVPFAFTLIELLVVVAIISILASLLLPALASGKQKAKRIQCINNHHQLAMTWMLYTTDSDDWLASNGICNPESTANKLWVQGAFVHTVANTNTDYMMNPQYAQFANYLKSPKVYLCPTDRDTVKVNNAVYPKFRSYSMNAYLGWKGTWEPRLSSNYKIFTTFGRMNNAVMPKGMFLFQDVNPDSICWPFFGVQMDTDLFFNFPGSSHSRGTVMSFADTHVEWHRWQDARTIFPNSPNYHTHSDASPGNADLAWMRDRTTVRNASLLIPGR